MAVKKNIFLYILLMLCQEYVTTIAFAKSDPHNINFNIHDGWNMYYKGEYSKAENIAKKLILNDMDKNGNATLLLARIRYINGLYKEALNLLQNHNYLKQLHLVSNPNASFFKNEKLSSDKKIIYYRLKGIWGMARYHMGDRDNAVLKDLIDSVAYDDDESLFVTPDVEAMQSIALMSFQNKNYDRSIIYWKRTIKNLEKILNQDRSLASKSNNAFLGATKYNIACAYAKMSRAKQAIEWLNKSLEYNRKSRIAHILKDPDLDNIRGDSQFKQFISSLKQ